MKTEAELKAIVLKREGRNIFTEADAKAKRDALNELIQLKVEAATASLQEEINLLNRALKRYAADNG